jgi:hypothetical protein
MPDKIVQKTVIETRDGVSSSVVYTEESVTPLTAKEDLVNRKAAFIALCKNWRVDVGAAEDVWDEAIGSKIIL